MVLGYSNCQFNPWDDFRLFFCPLSTSLNTGPINAKGAAASYNICISIIVLELIIEKITYIDNFLIYFFGQNNYENKHID